MSSILNKLPLISTQLKSTRNLIRSSQSINHLIQLTNYTTTQTNANVIKKHTLKDQIVQRIKIGGPITINDYMKIVLTAPNSVSRIF